MYVPRRRKGEGPRLSGVGARLSDCVLAASSLQQDNGIGTSSASCSGCVLVTICPWAPLPHGSRNATSITTQIGHVSSLRCEVAGFFTSSGAEDKRANTDELNCMSMSALSCQVSFALWCVHEEYDHFMPRKEDILMKITSSLPKGSETVTVTTIFSTTP